MFVAFEIHFAFGRWRWSPAFGRRSFENHADNLYTFDREAIDLSGLSETEIRKPPATRLVHESDF